MPTPLTDADKVLRNDTGKDIVEKLDDIAQALGVGVNADQINYDNTESGLEADDVQNAIDELNDNKADKTDLDTTTSITTPAPIQTFSDGGDDIPMKSLVTEIVPIQEGSGVPSPQNVRAISGHSSVNVVVTGKNILDSSIANRNYTSPYTFIRFGGTSADPVDGSLYLAKGTYTFSISTTAYIIRALDKDNQSIEFVNSDNKLTFTLTESQKCMITMAISGNVQVSDFTYQLELNDEATTYEAYKGSNTTIPLGQTVYGGSLECVEGEGQITHGYIELDGSNDEQFNWVPSGSTIYINIQISDLKGGTLDGACNWLQVHTDSTQFGVRLGASSTSKYILFDRITENISDVTDLESWRTYLSSHPIQVVYPLATPTSLSVSGANIPTLSGVNNVYTDCGDIQSVEYFNNKTDELANLIRLMTRS